MNYLPIFIKIRDEHCLVVGGGEVAARKVSLLQKAGAKVTVVAPKIGTTLRLLSERTDIKFRQKKFSPNDILGFRLVVSATGHSEINAGIAILANEHKIPVNVVDSPKLSSFIFPAIIDRSPVIAAVSTGGASPVLSRLLRSRLESLIPPAYGRLAELAQSYRSGVKTKINNSIKRRLFWEKILLGPIAELVFADRHEEAERQLEQQLLAGELNQNTIGQVFLVGAGPGDPDLLTFRALRLMQMADVVVYDRLVSPEILELVRRDAEKIYAGKERGKHTLPQDRINNLLAKLAKAGKCVVRLKGGDPFIFGRGGEEIETLMEAGIPFQVVPGITAASGCATYAGIPLTHRDYAQSCVFISGHLQNNSHDLNLKQLSIPRQTLVIYMGLIGLTKICETLIQNGSSPDQPAALIQQGTTPQQRIIIGTLKTLPSKVISADIRPPTLIIVGDVVKLHQKLAWFKTDHTKEPAQE